MSSLGSEHNARRSRERVLSRVSTNPLAWLGVSDQSFAAAAQSGAPAPSNPLSWLGVSDQSYAAISGAPPPKSIAEQAADASRSAARVTGGLQPSPLSRQTSVVGRLFATPAPTPTPAPPVTVAGSGSTLPNSQASSSGISPMLIGAIAVAVGVVGFVVYSTVSRKKKRK